MCWHLPSLCKEGLFSALEHDAGKAEEMCALGHSKNRHGPGLSRVAWGHLAWKSSRDITIALSGSPGARGYTHARFDFSTRCPNMQSQPDVSGQWLPSHALHPAAPPTTRNVGPAGLCHLTCVTAKKECILLVVLKFSANSLGRKT